MRYVEAHLPEEAATWTELVLLPIADVHIGAPEYNEPLFLETLEWVRQAPHRFVIINGDVLDLALRYSKGDVYRATMSPSDARRYAQKVLEPIKDRILAWTDGNHEERLSREANESPGEILAEALGVPHDREGIVVKLVFGPGNGKRPRPIAYQVYATHGSSNARRPGGKLNHLQDTSDNWEGLDIVIGSHTHVKAALKERRLVADPYNKRVSFREVTLVNSSTFLDWGGYSERRAYRPSSLGPPHLILSGVRKHVQVVL